MFVPSRLGNRWFRARVWLFPLLRAPLSAPLTLICVVVLACDTFYGPSDNGDPLIQTDALEYQLTPDWVGLRVEIPYTFTNRTGDRVYLVNCNGSFSIHLEREQDGEWKHAWSPVHNLCLSPPIVVEPNGTFSDTLNVWGAPPDSLHIGPSFDVADPSGVYRIVWGTGLWSFQSDTLPFGPLIPLEWRISNHFTLRR